jgi:hypothetical protein
VLVWRKGRSALMIVYEMKGSEAGNMSLERYARSSGKGDGYTLGLVCN